eukprot:352399-Chlamydomonas_euryale.AAC.6
MTVALFTPVMGAPLLAHEPLGSHSQKRERAGQARRSRGPARPPQIASIARAAAREASLRPPCAVSCPLDLHLRPARHLKDGALADDDEALGPRHRGQRGHELLAAQCVRHDPGGRAARRGRAAADGRSGRRGSAAEGARSWPWKRGRCGAAHRPPQRAAATAATAPANAARSHAALRVRHDGGLPIGVVAGGGLSRVRSSGEGREATGRRSVCDAAGGRSGALLGAHAAP